MNRIGDSLFHSGRNEEIIRAFVNFNVEFLLVGGLALAWHIPTRQADDMDLIVNPITENSKRVFSALASLGQVADSELAFNSLGQQLILKGQGFYADILTPGFSSLSYTELSTNALPINLFNISIFIPSKENLLRLLTEANEQEYSEKHAKDIELLKLSNV